MTETPEQTLERWARAMRKVDNNTAPSAYYTVFVEAIAQSDAEAGMVLVPREPTSDMLAEALIAGICERDARAAWDAMVSMQEDER